MGPDDLANVLKFSSVHARWFGAGHPHGPAFLSEHFAERAGVAVLLDVGGAINRQRHFLKNRGSGGNFTGPQQARQPASLVQSLRDEAMTELSKVAIRPAAL